MKEWMSSELEILGYKEHSSSHNGWSKAEMPPRAQLSVSLIINTVNA